jgi:hypothetical protein
MDLRTLTLALAIAAPLTAHAEEPARWRTSLVLETGRTTWGDGETTWARTVAGVGVEHRSQLELGAAIGFAANELAVPKRDYSTPEGVFLFPSQTSETRAPIALRPGLDLSVTAALPLALSSLFALRPFAELDGAWTPPANGERMSITAFGAGAGVAVEARPISEVRAAIGLRAGWRWLWLSSERAETATLDPARFPIGVRGTLEIQPAAGGPSLTLALRFVDETMILLAPGWTF